MKDVKGKGMTNLFYQLSSIMINTAICCVAEEGIIDGLVRGNDLKSQRKNVPTLTRTLDLRDRVGLSLICYHNGNSPERASGLPSVTQPSGHQH